MKQGKMILLDPDKEYGRRLAEYFNVSGWMPFKVEVFSDSVIMENYIKTMEPDLLMVNEILLKEEFRKFPLLVLCETPMTAEMDSPQIYKYQSARAIGKEVVSWYAGQAKYPAVFVKQNRLKVLGAYSLDKKREKSLLAWEIAKYLGKKGRTLYLNLEPYSGMEEYIGKYSGECLSDYLFSLRQYQTNTGFCLQGITEQMAGIDYMPPAKAWEDIRDIQTEEWRRLIQAVEMETEYDNLVFDISEAAGDFVFWLSVCEKVFMPVGEDFYSQMRKKEMQTFLEKRTDKELLAKWEICSLGGWQNVREYTEDSYLEVEKVMQKLLQE